MTVTAKTISAHEFIGLWVKIVDSSDPKLNDLIGTIVFETRNTLLIRTSSTIRRIPKKTMKKIAIQTETGVCFISGSSIIGRPEDRISRLN
jgi:ribonuclease P protein subunit POP4